MGRQPRHNGEAELTAREEQVRARLALGLTDAEIAQQLDVSTAAVSRHVSEIISKLSVRNRHEAASWPERPPWWAGAFAPVAFVWRKGTAVLPAKANSLALVASGGALAAALGGLGLIAVLLANLGGGADATDTSGDALAAQVEPGEQPPGLAAGPELPPALDASDPAAPPEPEETPTPPPPTATNEVSTETPEPPPTLSPPPTADDVRAPPPTPTPTPWGAGCMALDCDPIEDGVQSDCEYYVGEAFDLQVHVTYPPADGYHAFQTKVGWASPIFDYLPAPDSSEALWRECDVIARYAQAPPDPYVLFGCVPFPLLAFGNTETGPVQQLRIRCRDLGEASIELQPLLDGLYRATFFLDRAGNPIEPALAGASVTCAPCPEAGCPKPPPTPIPTPTPPPMPTPTPSGSGGMALDCDASVAGVQAVCDYPAGATFDVQLHIMYAPLGGYFGFESNAVWDGAALTYLPTDPRDEVLSPDEQECRIAARDYRQGQGDSSLRFACVPFPAPASGFTTTGALLQFQFRCEADGTSRLTLSSAEPGPTQFLDQEDNPVIPELMGATVTCGG